MQFFRLYRLDYEEDMSKHPEFDKFSVVGISAL